MTASKSRIFGIVCGMSGYGKTFFIQNYLLPSLLKRGKPVIIIDVMNEYKGHSVEGFKGLVRYIQKNDNRLFDIAYSVKNRTAADTINTLRLIRAAEQPVSVIIEEAHILFSDPDIKKQLKNTLQELTLYGRHYEIDVILSSQRPNLLSTTVRSQAQFFVSFRQEERADLDYLAVRSTLAAEKIATLGKKQFFTFGDPPDGFHEMKQNKINQLKK